MPYERHTREERRNEILLGALEVFLQKGYRDTTMEDIIKNTSLSKGGFYHYYKNKENILIDLIRMKNFNYLYGKLKVRPRATKDEVCRQLARVFVDRMMDQTSQSKLFLMMAMELANDTQAFYDLYYEVEDEAIQLIVSAIKLVAPHFDEDKKMSELMLLYRVNNTLHFVSNLYVQKEGWNVSANLLFDLYYEMFKKLIV
ncbi:TetR/AcrR family transcriptional regulator [Pyramidobacter sp. SM-530-WT-4B]|uniref:TetR/AcrR family transcriptional regulator n=1 Tax=Pyramidobacter porci TaxID=2605789 RepID=A0A6L5YC96_9BACT|nr:TetR/AcrR family transcriptional regulator [Pyramidobacter porci]MDY2647213.1 TetR/AcrR family transcriptional regulator [Pyramidobacter porci]MST55743.1 TetR/AcrR family transcriptional regulator [Pyramidobacter porci]